MGDGGGAYQEVLKDNMRILPNNYPKVYPTEKKGEKGQLNGFIRKDYVGNDQQSKFKHKHNILLGYDFVDENDSDIQAWDMAISRKKKVERNKQLLKDNEIKTEIKSEIDENVSNENSIAPSNSTPVTSEEQSKKTHDTEINSNNVIESEVKNTMDTILSSVTEEERMRISLLSNVLKKHSPKKDILKKQLSNTMLHDAT